MSVQENEKNNMIFSDFVFLMLEIIEKKILIIMRNEKKNLVQKLWNLATAQIVLQEKVCIVM